MKQSRRAQDWTRTHCHFEAEEPNCEILQVGALLRIAEALESLVQEASAARRCTTLNDALKAITTHRKPAKKRRRRS